MFVAKTLLAQTVRSTDIPKTRSADLGQDVISDPGENVIPQSQETLPTTEAAEAVVNVITQSQETPAQSQETLTNAEPEKNVIPQSQETPPNAEPPSKTSPDADQKGDDLDTLAAVAASVTPPTLSNKSLDSTPPTSNKEDVKVHGKSSEKTEYTDSGSLLTDQPFTPTKSSAGGIEPNLQNAMTPQTSNTGNQTEDVLFLTTKERPIEMNDDDAKLELLRPFGQPYSFHGNAGPGRGAGRLSRKTPAAFSRRVTTSGRRAELNRHNPHKLQDTRHDLNRTGNPEAHRDKRHCY